jgi:hypothetical protein
MRATLERQCSQGQPARRPSHAGRGPRRPRWTPRRTPARPKRWRPRGGRQPRPAHWRAGLTTAARGPRGSIGHDGAQGHEADAEAAADATRTGAPRVGRIRRPLAQGQPGLAAGGAPTVRLKMKNAMQHRSNLTSMTCSEI